MNKTFLALLWLCAFPSLLGAQEWSAPVRGSWVRSQASPQSRDVTLVRNGREGCEIVVGSNEHTAVKQAATFLAGDIEKISGYKPPIVTAPTGRRVAIHFETRSDGRWEAYQVRTENGAVWLIGSDFRGTAYAGYTLSERLGIDPLYLWTGLTPEKHPTLVMKATNFSADPPTFRYRGFFHDDEDILPRPFDDNGYPLQTGTVPREWYARFFETALRLRLNMVAPYVRVQRSHDIQKMASDWGLFYTSHHYDALLSNPWGFTRFGLADARNAGTEWDWFKNREGLLNFWRGGVLENRDVDAIWPVGLRGTQDRSYTFPDGMSEDEKNKAYREAIEAQVAMTKSLLPADKTPLFHFTLYTEMLPQYLSGKLEVPPEVTIVWTDDNDGHMRALPQAKDQWKHGVYYHLAYFSTTTRLTKQITHIVAPSRVEEEFRNIVKAGATEYMLVNVSELREFVMEARMLAEITWDANRAFAQPNAAERYTRWFAREYFGPAAATEAAEAYGDYYQILSSYDQISVGSNAVQDALAALRNRQPIAADRSRSLEQRDETYQDAMKRIASASARMSSEQKQYFYENVTFPLLVDWRQTTAAIKLMQASASNDAATVRRLGLSAFDDLKTLEDEIRRAERPPFELWYRKTWIRNDDSPYNLHRSYERTKAFLTERNIGLTNEAIR
jgi:hypothetical protein